MFDAVIAGLRFREEIRQRFNSNGRLDTDQLFYIEDFSVDEDTFHDFWQEACAQERNMRSGGRFAINGQWCP
jgi:hypothetical protein